jgi:hypothetical protein
MATPSSEVVIKTDKHIDSSATHTTSEIPGRNSVDFDQSDTSDTTQEDSENYNLNQEVLASAGYKRARATEIREECRIANAMARHANFGYPRCEPLRHMIDEDGVLQTVLAEETRIIWSRDRRNGIRHGPP